jgi:hypothetical protein
MVVDNADDYYIDTLRATYRFCPELSGGPLHLHTLLDTIHARPYTGGRDVGSFQEVFSPRPGFRAGLSGISFHTIFSSSSSTYTPRRIRV